MMTSTERAGFMTLANRYNPQPITIAVDAAVRLLDACASNKERLVLLVEMENHGLEVVLRDCKENPPKPDAITQDVLHGLSTNREVVEWLLQQYKDSREVKSTAQRWSKDLAISNNEQVLLLAGLLEGFQAKWLDFLCPERIEINSIHSLVNAAGCRPEDFPGVADIAAKKVSESASRVEAEDWFSVFVDAIDSVVGDDAVLRWCQSALQRFADQPEVWRPALRWLAERVRRCGGPRLDIGTLTPEQATTLSEYWYEFARDDERHRVHILEDFGRRSPFEDDMFCPLIAVPVGSPLSTRAVWTWLADEEVEAALYAAFTRAESSACELWQYTEDRMTSRLFDQMEAQFRQAQADLNRSRGGEPSARRVVLAFTQRDMRFGQDVAGADLALVFKAEAPKLHERCSFALVQAKKPDRNTLSFDTQLRKQVVEMLYHTHAAYVLIYPNQARQPMFMLPATTLRAALVAGARSFPLPRARACSRGLAEALALDMVGGWVGDERYKSEKEVVDVLEHNVRPRKIVTISVTVVPAETPQSPHEGD